MSLRTDGIIQERTDTGQPNSSYHDLLREVTLSVRKLGGSAQQVQLQCTASGPQGPLVKALPELLSSLALVLRLVTWRIYREFNEIKTDEVQL